MAVSVLLAGCASTTEHDPRDPLEPMNRAVFSFNEKVDKVLLQPLAKGYTKVTPRPVRHGVHNVFSNLDDVTEFANDVLQFKPQPAATDLLRVCINTSFGLLGIFDVASEMHLQKHNEDFGQTLGRWGFHSGPYLVLPILGPSDFRDGIGLWVDSNYDDPVYQIKDIASRNDALALKLISHKAEWMKSQAALEAAALDKYDFTRDFYLSRRRSLVYDGNPPADGE